MLKKYIHCFSFLIALLLLAQTYAEENIKAEAKAGYFMFTDSHMRDVYDRGGYQLGLSASYACSCHFDLYANIAFIKASGKSTNFKQRSTFYQVPLDLGIKPTLRLNSNLDWFMAFGPRFSYSWQNNHSRSVNKNLSSKGLGIFVNTGLNFFPCCKFNYSIFVEYSYLNARPVSSKHRVHRRSLQIGGLSFGASLGYSF